MHRTGKESRTGELLFRTGNRITNNKKERKKRRFDNGSLRFKPNYFGLMGGLNQTRFGLKGVEGGGWVGGGGGG